MSKLGIILTFLFIVVVAVFGSWLYFDNVKGQNQPINTQPTLVDASSNKAIASFSFAQINPIVNGVINDSNHTVTLVVPYGTDITNLVPTIEVSDGAAITPASGALQNFSNSVIYTVNAPDGTHQDYTVSVTIAPNIQKTITAFAIAGQLNNTAIDQDAHTILVTVPYGTNISSLMPTIITSNNTTVSPASLAPQDFTNPVTYTVTATDNTTQNYIVTVIIAPNPSSTSQQ